jgi:hypothetical protein
MQAEYVACYEALGQAVWLKNFVLGIKVIDNILRPIMMYCDNEAALPFVSNNTSIGGAKHIDIKYRVVKERIQDQTIQLKHISSKYMLVDLLTKGLPPILFRQHAKNMDLTDSL